MESTSVGVAEPPDTSGRTFEPAQAMRWSLAALSCGAGVIHLAMVPQHAQESLRAGLGFAAAGWFQIAFAVAIMARPSRTWVRLAIVGNAVFVATWVLSRTAGLPSWTGEGGVESASAIDILCVALEVGVIIAAIAVLVAPNLLETWNTPLASVRWSSRWASSSEPRRRSRRRARRNTCTAVTQAIRTLPAATATTMTRPPRLIRRHQASTLTTRPNRRRPTTTITARARPSTPSFRRETKAEVDQVSALWANKYPTAADAEQAGWWKATPSLYGIGAHYIKGVSGLSVAVPFDLLNPNILLYDGEGPDAKFAGVSYVVAGDVEGYTGSYDFWHAHSSVCIGSGGITLTEENSPYWYSEPECTASGGRVMPLAADKMIHVWIGPGYTDAPTFAHDNPELLDGYYPKRDT